MSMKLFPAVFSFFSPLAKVIQDNWTVMCLMIQAISEGLGAKSKLGCGVQCYRHGPVSLISPSKLWILVQHGCLFVYCPLSDFIFHLCPGVTAFLQHWVRGAHLHSLLPSVSYMMKLTYLEVHKKLSYAIYIQICWGYVQLTFECLPFQSTE